MKRTLFTMLSGFVVYAAIAACSAADGGSSFTDPVAVARAEADAGADASAPPNGAPSLDVSEVFCDQTVGDVRYAQKAYPGANAIELASQVVAVVRLTDAHDVPPAPAGYTQQMHPLAWIRDGAVTAICGSATAPTFPYVTFVRRLPR